MFCPQCKSEYVEGITECAECQVALVEELPPEPVPEYEDLRVVRTYSADHDAELGKSILEANGIEAVIASDEAGGTIPGLALTRGVQLLVDAELLEKAETVFKDLEASQDNDDLTELAEQAETPEESE
jgi:hypothetical protein